MDMNKEFAKLESKAARSRKTIAEMLEIAGIPRISYWRAKNGKYAKNDTAIAILAKCEQALDGSNGKASHNGNNGKVGADAPQG